MLTLRDARKKAVPLVVLETPDNAAAIASALKNAANGGDVADVPAIRWNMCAGFSPLTSAGQDALGTIGDGPTLTNPTDALISLQRLDARGLVFFENMHRFWQSPDVLQATWNLRDTLKSNGGTLVCLVPLGSPIPADLSNDVITLTDPLPDAAQLAEIATRTLQGFKDTCTAQRVACEWEPAEQVTAADMGEALLGVSAFAAEQITSLAVSPRGINVEVLRDRRRRTIEATPGLSMMSPDFTFDDVKGYENIKNHLRALANGPEPPHLYLLWDEFEKSIAASGTDSSGVSQDRLRQVLVFIEETRAAAMLFVGQPGSGKTLVASAAAATVGAVGVSMDFGAMTGSLVGESERKTREAFNVCRAISGGRVAIMATVNSTANLPPEVRRRFAFGTFFFPPPDTSELADIWQYHKNRRGLTDATPASPGWTGAEVRNACDIAYRLRLPLKDATRRIVPVAVSAAEKIDALCREAHRRYVSASVDGEYIYPKLAAAPLSTEGGRNYAV